MLARVEPFARRVHWPFGPQQTLGLGVGSLVVALLLLTAFGVGANQPLMLAVWFVPYFIGVLLAYVDQRALKASLDAAKRDKEKARAA